jgi:hypothetical protein
VSVSLVSGGFPGEQRLAVTALDGLLQGGQLPLGLITHDTWLDPSDATGEQCLRTLAVTLLFHPTYGGDAGLHAADALGTIRPAAPGMLDRIRGPLPGNVHASFDLSSNDEAQHRCALVALRWILTGEDEGAPVIEPPSTATDPNAS